jgi:hypothetical protein
VESLGVLKSGFGLTMCCKRVRRFTAKVNCSLKEPGEVLRSPSEVNHLTRNEAKAQEDTQPGGKARIGLNRLSSRGPRKT